MKKKKVALVLSGGGARGIAHIGAIEELLDNGFEITSVAGTSMGAMVGSVYAMGKLEEYKDWLLSLDKMKIFKLVDFTFSSQGLIKGDRVLTEMKKFIEDTRIEDLKIPFAAVSADLLNRKEVVFTEGSVYEAIRASIAIPTIFTPVTKEKSLLVDGGVMNNIPIDHVKRTKGDKLVVVNVNANIPIDKPAEPKKVSEEKNSIYKKKIAEFQEFLQDVFNSDREEKLGYFDLIDKTIGLMIYHNAQSAIEKHSPDILIEVSRDACATYDFYKAGDLVEIGRHAARKGIMEYSERG
ncbi:MAG: patatin-like phospholipase family protein [Bacteroidales bacterium]|nr:patatin-like phospholipase family protein [Bacteroidales bacterium]